jgi:hypothetical protein
MVKALKAWWQTDNIWILNGTGSATFLYGKTLFEILSLPGIIAGSWLLAQLRFGVTLQRQRLS